MKIDDVIARVQRGDDSSKLIELKVSPYELGVIVQRTILAVGLQVAADGEVYDPAPKPVINYPQHQNGARWKGGRGRRR